MPNRYERHEAARTLASSDGADKTALLSGAAEITASWVAALFSARGDSTGWGNREYHKIASPRTGHT